MGTGLKVYALFDLEDGRKTRVDVKYLNFLNGREAMLMPGDKVTMTANDYSTRLNQPSWKIESTPHRFDQEGFTIKYGYLADDGKKTYQNTAQFDPPNSQGLFLNVNQLKALLELQAQKSRVEDVAAWRLIKLHQRLTTKHHETFWIEDENAIHDNKEYFCYKQIKHTRNPNVGQFDILLEQNLITVDLLLCRPSGNGDTYSFKIKKKGMPLLFPESLIYNLKV